MGVESRNVGEAVVADGEQRQIVISEREQAIGIEFVLLAMFEPIQESIAVRSLQHDPGMRISGWAPAADGVDIAVVAGYGQERLQLRAEIIGGGKILGVVSLADVEGAAIGLHAFDCRGNQNVRIGIAVAVGVGREIIGNQIAANLHVLSDWFAVISGDARSKILRRFYSARSSLDWQTRKRYRSAGTSGIGVQSFFANQHTLCGVGRENGGIFYVRDNRYGLLVRGDF